MLSNNSGITGAKWGITKNDFLKMFNEATDPLAKKAVVALLFNISIPPHTEWQPDILVQDLANPDNLILKYTIWNVIPMATLEDLNKVELGPEFHRDMILSGFHKYSYAKLPTLQLFLVDKNSCWINENYFVVQINKTQKQLEQYFSQVVRGGIDSQEQFAQYLNTFLKVNGYQLKYGFAFRFRDEVTSTQDPRYNLKNSFFSPESGFEHEGQLHDALKKIVRSKATYGADNALGTLIVE